MKVSVVIPAYNEEDNITPLAEELSAVSEHFDHYEVLLVDDGSKDATWKRICDCAEKFEYVHGLRLLQNSGQSAAMLKGLAAATGDILVTLDADLQNNPADIPAVVQAMGDADAVCGYRAKRKDSWSRRAGSKLGNSVRNYFTHDGIRDTGCSLKAFRKECVKALPPVDGVHRFMPAYFKTRGHTIIEIAVDHRERIHGDSKYTNAKRLPRTLFDLIGFCWYRKRMKKLDAIQTEFV